MFCFGGDRRPGADADIPAQAGRCLPWKPACVLNGLRGAHPSWDLASRLWNVASRQRNLASRQRNVAMFTLLIIVHIINISVHEEFRAPFAQKSNFSPRMQLSVKMIILRRVQLFIKMHMSGKMMILPKLEYNLNLFPRRGIFRKSSYRQKPSAGSPETLLLLGF